MNNSKPRRKFLGGMAAILCGLAFVAIASAPAQADGPRRNYRRGTYVGRPAYRANVYRRPYNGGYRPAPNYSRSPRYYGPQQRLYVPPARTYYGPPTGYYPPML